jgi:hypothetical protein
MRPRHLAESFPAAPPLLAALACCAAAGALADPAPKAQLTVTQLKLPGGPPVSMDYLAFDAGTGRLWIPAGNTGRVDVLDTASGKLEAIEGLATEQHGPRTAGPSAASVGDGVAFIGNRAGAQVCAFDAKTLAKRSCLPLGVGPDGVQYVPATKEVWVTTPHHKSVTLLDAKDPGALKLAGQVTFEGEPEGYALDPQRGLFFTSLEDKNETLAVDVKTRKVVAQWKSGCSEKGPRGLAIDPAREQLLLGCNEAQVRIFSYAKGKEGALLGTFAAGAGVDNIDYLPSRHLLYVAAGAEGTLSVAEVSEAGAAKQVGQASTGKGGRSVFVDAAGTAYVPDSGGGALWVAKVPQ